MVAPSAMPVTIPDDEPIVAMPGLLLSHVPPPLVTLSPAEALTQTAVGPLMGDGSGLMAIAALPVILLVHSELAELAVMVYTPDNV